MRRRTVARRVLLALILVLVRLDSIFSDTTHDGTTDCSEETVVGLVTSETTGSAACKSTCETTLTVLGAIGSLFVGSIKGQSSVHLRIKSKHGENSLMLAVLVLLVLVVGLLLAVVAALLLLVLLVVVVGVTALAILLVTIALTLVLAVTLLRGVATLAVALTTVAALLVAAVAVLTLVVGIVARHDVGREQKVEEMDKMWWN